MKRRFTVRALTFEYHGIAERELSSARLIASRAGVKEQRVVRVPDLKEAGDMPQSKFEGLPPTYIPMRNSIFYSFAASYAEEVGASYIVGGHNRDDSAVFADVSREFFGNLEAAFRAGSLTLGENRLEILRPLEGERKAEVVKSASEIGVPLGLTWSCHRDVGEHCWECPGCRSRKKAFMDAGVTDPLSGRGAKVT